jgi:hypothetical protein
MNIDLNLSLLRRTFVQMKAVEVQLNKTLEPVLPTLRQIAELQRIYREIHGVAEEDIPEDEPVAVIEKPIAKVKTKTKKEALFVEPTVKFPEGTVWQVVKIVTKSEDTMEFFYRDTSMGVYTNQQLGFTKGNTSDKKPNRECSLLRMMAACLAYKGVENLVLTKQLLMKVCEVTSENAVEKQKSDLATKLRIITGIHEEPFLPYSSHMGYQPKFELLPETMLQGDPELYPSGREFIDEEFDGATLRT